MKVWRLIIDGAGSASFNMAADTFLLENAENPQTEPVLRLYGWDKPSITIGYHQRLDRAIRLEALGDTPVVRRPTGGRALLHDSGEITYALAGNYHVNNELGETLQGSCQNIAEAVAFFYQRLGWTVDICPKDTPVALSGGSREQKGCLATVSRHEITINGCKMAAGAQRRYGPSFLHHGIMRLRLPVMHPAINHGEPGRYQRAAFLLPPPTEVLPFVIDVFARRFAVGWRKRPWTGTELEAIGERIEDFADMNRSNFVLNNEGDK